LDACANLLKANSHQFVSAICCIQDSKALCILHSSQNWSSSVNHSAITSQVKSAIVHKKFAQASSHHSTAVVSQATHLCIISF